MIANIYQAKDDNFYDYNVIIRTDVVVQEVYSGFGEQIREHRWTPEEWFSLLGQGAYYPVCNVPDLVGSDLWFTLRGLSLRSERNEN